jgi:uncharacterized protein
MNTIWLAFITGLTTGGVSCLAVQGGVLASAVTQSENGVKSSSKRIVLIGLFLLAKLIAYVMLGIVLGTLGSTLQFSPKVMGYTQILVGLFMIATAARLLDLHPIFRYTVIMPPRFIYKIFRKSGSQQNFFAPLLMGALTIFMPCGITQAMMVAALSSGNAVVGGLTMGAFVIGTSPIFFALGATFVALLEKKIFIYIASALIALFGFMTINGGFALIGSIYTFQNLYRAAVTPIGEQTPKTPALVAGDGIQDVTITVTNRGYESETKILKKNVPVRLHLITNGVGGCARAFTIPDKNISKVLPQKGEEIIMFTPDKAGNLTYSCSMGMYTGMFEVE